MDFGSHPLFNAADFLALGLRLAFDLFFVFLLVGGIYHRLYRRRDYVFTYVLFNIITFFLCFLLRRVPIELGFALGLFAVFGILRYRTEAIRMRDLTYLFVVIGLAIVNAVANEAISVAELVLVNVVILVATYLLEQAPLGERIEEKSIVYDNLSLLHPGKESALYADLAERTGLAVRRVSVDQINLLRETAAITIYFAHVPK
ncbi:MAG: DUF4956 domain-containing protein [Myxococcales bacterium]|nr:DUF4956 domain-containing protein [Myxococcales bacterium]